MKDFAGILSKLSRFGKQTFKGHHPGAEQLAAIGDPSFALSRNVYRAFVLLEPMPISPWKLMKSVESATDLEESSLIREKIGHP